LAVSTEGAARTSRCNGAPLCVLEQVGVALHLLGECGVLVDQALEILGVSARPGAVQRNVVVLGVFTRAELLPKEAIT
jgi:hypothetical protein